MTATRYRSTIAIKSGVARQTPHASRIVAGDCVKQKIQIVLDLAMIVAGIRLAWIFYERQQAAVQPRHKEAPLLNPDYYVTPKKLYPYDLKSAKQLTKQPVWVKIGYAYSYYPYNSAAHRADLS